MTQKEQVLAHLMSIGPITQKTAFEDYGISDLAGRIRDLRREGVPIVREDIPFRTRLGKKSKFASYRLEENNEIRNQ